MLPLKYVEPDNQCIPLPPPLNPRPPPLEPRPPLGVNPPRPPLGVKPPLPICVLCNDNSHMMITLTSSPTPLLYPSSPLTYNVCTQEKWEWQVINHTLDTSTQLVPPPCKACTVTIWWLRLYICEILQQWRSPILACLNTFSSANHWQSLNVVCSFLSMRTTSSLLCTCFPHNGQPRYTGYTLLQSHSPNNGQTMLQSGCS